MAGNIKAQVLPHFLTAWFGSEKTVLRLRLQVRKRRKSPFLVGISLSSKPTKCLKRKCDYAKDGRDTSLLV